MKVLYAFQGTGNGHHTRAVELLPALRARADVDVLVSSAPSDKCFDLPVDHRFQGLGFRFGRNGGIDLRSSFMQMDSRNFFREIKAVPVGDYDLVINDFEPVTAWACRHQGVPLVGLSHQAAVLHPHSPKPERTDWFSIKVLQHYAPTPQALGFHFQAYADAIRTPIIRQAVRDAAPSNLGHIAVYLPAYSSARIAQVLKHFPGREFHVFSPRWQKPFRRDGLHFFPADPHAFTESMASSAGVLCGAGFEAPAEALHLGKSLLVIPMAGQLEQQCNAQALKEMGAHVIPRLTTDFIPQIQQWLAQPPLPAMCYPDERADLVGAVLAMAVPHVTA